MTDPGILQDLFDRSLAHVARHGRSLGMSGCAYRGKNLARCAVGALITDAAYARHNILDLCGPMIFNIQPSGSGTWEARTIDGEEDTLGARALADALNESGVTATPEVAALLDQLQQAHDYPVNPMPRPAPTAAEFDRLAVEKMREVGRKFGLEIRH